MKVLSVLALTVASASAFMPAAPAFARVSASLQMTPEEDLELTRKAIHDFDAAQSGEKPAPAEKKAEAAPAPAEKKAEEKKKPVAAKK
mmetsp:Transcript_17777/g.23017  ORF Transcript_17777/g.23017 Transcript_17777/m.23017 type:complete len:88 (+) Transcript_17777:214-477(+)|eukprot:CAMPEP_0198138326 /NCGR_PEP_ID=MMETSP1443-20131203/1732_1 /TAXON_ID=186043 /ORGANISM="Entomoneis sp., Strain CCMP2396" /LENGTH=87 /DNA_ID=CAMNT_0043800049 /DNA_START=188 /DNA_END=451 /DNA_ORIENTATION=-